MVAALVVHPVISTAVMTLLYKLADIATDGYETPDIVSTKAKNHTYFEAVKLMPVVLV